MWTYYIHCFDTGTRERQCELVLHAENDMVSAYRTEPQEEGAELGAWSSLGLRLSSDSSQSVSLYSTLSLTMTFVFRELTVTS